MVELKSKWVLTIHHALGAETFIARTRNDVDVLLHRWVARWWPEVASGEDMPEDAGEAVETYFERKGDEERYDVVLADVFLV